ncbi:branched-chain amino acid ABC transporter substrate-binding protein [Benzoatithermus flavus]|uniref:Branched-chain amino acid ABC transporter substrate-binding protein n=1 Tax=Benzoatithermus flavus TaxID=3108223 RepID=A0ABU8XTR3_9PROT
MTLSLGLARRRLLGASAVVALAGLAHAAPAAADVTVGVALGLTGPAAAYGEQAKHGIDAAVAVINRGGGANGEKIRLETADDACDPKQAVAVANRFASQGVKLVLGHLCSSATIAAADVYADEGIVMITASATNPAVTEKGHEMVFRACGRDDQQGAAAGQMLAERFKGKKIAVVDDKSAYGKGLAEQAELAMKAKGVEPALTSSVNAGEKDFSALITRLKQEGIDVVYYGGYHVELGLIVRQAREQGLEAQFVSGEATSAAEFWQITGPAGNGTLFTYAPEVKSQPGAAEAIKAIKEVAGPNADPDNFAFYYYAAVQILAQAIEKAGSAEPEAVAEALHGTPSFATVVGPMAFDAKGDLKAPAYAFYEWRDGRYAPARL